MSHARTPFSPSSLLAIALILIVGWPAGAAEQANIGGLTTQDLAGASLTYKYSTGTRLQLELEKERFTLTMPDDPANKPGSFPYLARRLDNGRYLVHCFVRNPGGHTLVTLLLDLPKKQVYVSAIIGDIEWFDVGNIEKMRLPDTVRLP